LGVLRVCGGLLFILKDGRRLLRVNAAGSAHEDKKSGLFHNYKKRPG
jgi:hypothetical protein